MKSGAVPDIIAEDTELGQYWITSWRTASGREFSETWVDEYRRARELLGDLSTATTYVDGLRKAGLFDPATRGSAVRTALASVFLLWLYPEPVAALKTAANTLGSDTDSIASMAGALVGGTSADLPSGPLLDSELISSEARRLAMCGIGRGWRGHRYPDLLRWVAPSAQADYLQPLKDNQLVLVGLGAVARVIGDPRRGRQGDFAWQWLELEFGQTVLVKRRWDGSQSYAILNYLYTLAETACTRACFALGLDPGLGILHTDQPRRDSLALDLIESHSNTCGE